MATITSANSVFMLAVGLVFPVPQKIEGYSTDDAFSVEANEPTENIMGVDGKMSSGFIPTMKITTISIQADSPSLFLFETWAAAQETAREVFRANGTIQLPSIGRKYALTNGSLSSVKLFPDAKKTLQPVQFRITWESISPALA